MNGKASSRVPSRRDSQRGTKGREGERGLPRDGLLPLSVPFLVVGRVVVDRELGVGGIAAHGAVGHGGGDGDGVWGWGKDR